METKKPICGSLSVAMPLIGFLVAFVGFTLIHDPTGPHQLSGMGVVILILSLLCPIAGVVLGIIGMIRRERLRWLPVLGFVLSIGCAASYFAA
jgi:hypothetical protein